jgi:hypothetical protein
MRCRGPPSPRHLACARPVVTEALERGSSGARRGHGTSPALAHVGVGGAGQPGCPPRYVLGPHRASWTVALHEAARPWHCTKQRHPKMRVPEARAHAGVTRPGLESSRPPYPVLSSPAGAPRQTTSEALTPSSWPWSWSASGCLRLCLSPPIGNRRGESLLQRKQRLLVPR